MESDSGIGFFLSFFFPLFLFVVFFPAGRSLAPHRWAAAWQRLWPGET